MIGLYEELGEPSRRAILMELRTGPKSVTDIVVATGLKQPNVSNHLARMRQRGLVVATKAGRQVYYSLASSEVENLLNNIAERNHDPQPIDLQTATLDYAKAAVDGDEAVCERIANAALRSGLTIAVVYTELLTSAMELVGNWVGAGLATIGQEHMASAITERILARAAGRLHNGIPHDGLAVSGCAPDSWHTLGLRMASDYLKVFGWQTLFLGANTPIESFVQTVQARHPQLVMTSCIAQISLEPTLALVQALAEIRQPPNDYRIVVGGWLAQQNEARFIAAGCDCVCSNLQALEDTVLATS